MPLWNVLIVEDDVTYRTALAKYFKGRYGVTVASTLRQAHEFLKRDHYDLVLLDLSLPDGDGLDFMKVLRKMKPDLTIIVMTGNGTVETAVRAVQRGAFHYLMKPFPLERLEQLVKEAQNQSRVTPVASYQLKKTFEFEEIVGSSSPMMDVFRLVEKVSNSDSTILIRGESGTGKELIAQAIHRQSHRADKSFVTVNCGALPEELLASELFGHVKGAFTGAIHSRQGRFELAHEGTIFLDEVGDMSPGLQVKLLRVLQEKQFERVGLSETVKVGVRIIAATHRNLEQAVQNGQFREDLYYRLNVIPVFMPSLREKRDDIPRLIEHFLQKFNTEKFKKVTGVTEEVIRALLHYPWPGNVRELENLMERLVIIKGEGQITSSDLPEKYFSKGELPQSWQLPEAGLDMGSMVSTLEEQLIKQALERTAGNQNQAARLLGLKRTTLVEKIKRRKIKLDVP